MIPCNFDAGMLAYLGDSVWELLVRERIFKIVPHGNKKANKIALDFVTARAQCEALEKMEEFFTDDENEIFRWGRNLKIHSHAPSVSIADYRRATGLEVLFGYLHVMNNEKRYRELFEKAFCEENC